MLENLVDERQYANSGSERAARWNRENKERRREINRKYREANKDKDEARRKLNVEKKKAYDKAYNLVHKDKKYKQNKKWASENLSLVRQYKKRYSDKHREMWRIYCHNRRTKTYIKITLEDISNWESRICGICNDSILDSYHIDHVVPLSRGGEHEVKNLQLTHPTCNLRKNNKLQSELVGVLV